MKAITFIKKNSLLLAAAAIVISFSAFKTLNNLNTQPEDGWYAIDIVGSNPNQPANQQVGNRLNTPPPTTGADCAQLNSGQRCAVYLEFTESASSLPSTMEDATIENGVIFDGTDAKHL